MTEKIFGRGRIFGPTDSTLCAVYMITHKATGRGYIGMTRGRPSDRWKQHRYGSTSKHLFPLITTAPDQFSYRVLGWARDSAAARVREQAEIAARGTLWPSGFNLPVRPSQGALACPPS